MRTVGIVAEYDPFHNGHLHHLTEARRAAEADYAVVILSGPFRQRGEPALLSPSDRAACALRSGADAVFELPVSCAVREAEAYALSAVSLLSELGCTHLAFGAETADLPLLTRAAEAMDLPPLAEALRSRLGEGLGYPAALSAALEALDPESGLLLRKPNNILAVSYLRAIRRLRSPLIPVVIPRGGDYHSGEINPAYPSASALRDSLLRGAYAPALEAVPDDTAAILHRRFLDRQIPDPRILSALTLDALRKAGPEGLRCQLPDLSEGLENRLYEAAARAQTLEDLIRELTTKRYPSARLRRLCIHALLAFSPEAAPFPPRAVRLLALREKTGLPRLWQGISLRILSSGRTFLEDPDLAADRAAYRVYARLTGRPDTWPYTERLVTR